MHLYVIRHGQSYVNLPDWTGEDNDAPLTPLGEQQAEALAACLPGYLPKVDAIYSSTMRRPRGTVAPVAKAYGQEVILDHRLREIGNNRIDHSPYPEDQTPTRSDWIGMWPIEKPFAPVTRAEGGESPMHFRIRVASFIEDMVERHRDERIIAVCHGGVMDAVFDYCFAIGPWRHCEVHTYNTGVSHFQFVTTAGKETWALHSHNGIEHLRALNDSLTY